MLLEVIDVDVFATGDKKNPKKYRLGLFQALIAAGDQLAELLSSEPVVLRDAIPLKAVVFHWPQRMTGNKSRIHS